MSFQLPQYLGRYHEICRKKGAPNCDFDKVRSKLSDLRSGARLSVIHFEIVYDRSLTPFAQFWPFPQNNLAERLQGQPTTVKIKTIEEKANVVEHALEVVQSIDVLALLLRCVYPEYFAVYGIPVVSLLPVAFPTNTVHYLRYCAELEIWQKHFGLKSVADTDMALWAFYQSVFVSGRDEKAKAEMEAFGADPFVCQRRAACALGPLLEQYKDDALTLSEILVPTSPRIAGMLAGTELEGLLKTQLKSGDDPELTIGNTIHKLCDANLIDVGKRKILLGINDIRNRCVHRTGKEPSSLEVSNMIKAVKIIFGKPARRCGPVPC
jgi:hypothetical protein